VLDGECEQRLDRDVAGEQEEADRDEPDARLRL
jgi:hypothetical protein